MSTNPYSSPETSGYEPPAAPPFSWWRNAAILFAVLLGAAVVVALLLPVRRGAGEAARRMQCGNNLKQLALALHNYEEDFGCFPPAYTLDDAGKPLHSWRTLLLPYLEQKPLYDKLDLAKPWNDPVNQAAVAHARLQVFLCPSANLSAEKTVYLAVTVPGGLFEPPAARKRAEITDGLAYTVAVVEVPHEHAVPWMAPVDPSAAFLLTAEKPLRSQHPGGCLAAFVDGHVEMLTHATPTEVRRAMATIAGGDDEVVSPAN